MMSFSVELKGFLTAKDGFIGNWPYVRLKDVFKSNRTKSFFVLNSEGFQ